MALPTLTTNINPFPTGKDKLQHSQVYKGTVALGAGGEYQTLGLPWSLSGSEVLNVAGINWAEMYSPSTGFTYRYDPVNKTIRIYEQTTVAGPLVELANLAAVTADTVYFRAECAS